MFGLSFGEIVVLVIVGMIVVGPRRIPTLMRTAGQWVAKLRRMSTELRSQSGIDDLIRQENLERELAELRSLTRANVVDSLISPAAAASAGPASRALEPHSAPTSRLNRARKLPLREREYPIVGCDAGGALPDDVPEHPPSEVDAAAALELGGADPVGAADPYGDGARDPAGPPPHESKADSAAPKADPAAKGARRE